MKKITFIGDITSDRPLLKAAKQDDGSYNFQTVFSKTQNLFQKSDIVIGNLETVCGGKIKDEFLLCNSPDELIRDMKSGYITCVTTANNHCLDQGPEGLSRTIDVLDKYNIAHTGTKKNKEDEGILYLKVGNCCIAVLSMTYSTNVNNTGIIFDEKNDYMVNVLRPQNIVFTGKKYKVFIKKLFLSILGIKNIRLLKRYIFRLKLKQGKNYMKAYTDIIQPDDTDNKYLNQMLEYLNIARQKADICFVVPHIGGQFNIEPGEYSVFLNRLLVNNGANAVVGHHPHIVQKIEKHSKKDNIIAYSIGSFNQSISADYILHDALPEYSIALHFYVVDKNENSYIDTVSFSILKIIEDENNMITVYPVDELAKELNGKERIRLESDVKSIYLRILGRNKKFPGFLKEYGL